MAHLVAFIRLSRFHFLAFSMLPYVLGLLVGWRDGQPPDARLLGYGLGIQLLVQLSTAYINDYFDLPTDRINARRTWLSGGSGELTTGLLPPRLALIAAVVCLSAALFLAVLAGIPPVSWPVLFIAMAAAVGYSTPPFQLAWRGLGELAAAMTAAWLAPMWAYSVQTGQLSAEVVRLGLPLVPLIAGMLLGIAAPDIPADRQVGKRTLAVIVGEGRIATLYAGLVAAGYVAALALLPGTGLVAVLVSLPMAVWAWWGLRAHHRLTGWRLLGMVARTAAVPALALAVIIAHLWVEVGAPSARPLALLFGAG